MQDIKLNNCHLCNLRNDNLSLCKICKEKFKSWYKNPELIETAIPFYKYYLELIRKNEYDFFLNKENITIPLEILICGGMKEKHKFISLIDKIINEDAVCSNIGNSIGKALIRNAATRIFAIPEQSIMELPVNSFDSYHQDLKIGKFGMGFFSIFYWLQNHPKRFLSIITRFEFLSKKYEYSLNIFTKSGLITELEIEMLYFKEVSLDTVTGTKIILDFNKDPLEQTYVSGMYNQLLKLRYYNKGLLIVNYDDSVIKINEFFARSNNLPVVRMILNSNTIQVEDSGSGIPIDISFGSLLVPSISTKKQNLEKELDIDDIDDLNDNVRVLPYTDSRFVFLVQGVAILDMKIKKDNYNLVLLFDFMQNARLPVARNDILFSDEINNPNYQSYELLLDMISLMINKLIQQHNNVIILQDAIEQYEKITSQSFLKGKLSSHVEEFIFNLQRRESYIFLSKKTYDSIIEKKTINQLDLNQIIQDAGYKVVIARLNNYTSSEFKLAEIFQDINRKDIFDSRNLIFTSGNLENTPITDTTVVRIFDFDYSIYVDSISSKEYYLLDIISQFGNEELQLISEIDSNNYQYSWESFYSKIYMTFRNPIFSSYKQLRRNKDIRSFLKDKGVKLFNVFIGMKRILGDNSISDEVLEYYISWYIVFFYFMYENGFINEINEISTITLNYIKSIPNMLKKTSYYSESSNFRIPQYAAADQFVFFYSPFKCLDFFNTENTNLLNNSFFSIFNARSDIKIKLVKYMTSWIKYVTMYSDAYKTPMHMTSDDPSNDYYLILVPSLFHFGILSLYTAINIISKGYNVTNLNIFLLNNSYSFHDYIIVSFILVTGVINNFLKNNLSSWLLYYSNIEILKTLFKTAIKDGIEKSHWLTKEDIFFEDDIASQIFLSKNKEKIQNILDYVRYKINLERKEELLLKIYESSFLSTYKSKISSFVFKNSALKEIKLYIKSLFSSNSVDNIIISSDDIHLSENAITVSLEKWINFVFSENIFLETFDTSAKEETNLELYNRLFDAYKSYKLGTRFQLNSLQIAMNEATTREWEQSVIIELIQNSIDAIVSNYNGYSKTKRININFGYFINQDQLAFSIEDFIGMKMSNLIAMMTPYFSTKSSTKESLTTGEMGNGWFQVYSNAETVNIITSLNGIQYRINDNVIRGKNRRIIDIERQIERVNLFENSIKKCPKDMINQLAIKNEILLELTNEEKCKQIISLFDKDRLLIPDELKEELIRKSNGTKITIIFRKVSLTETLMNKNRIANYINTILYNIYVPLHNSEETIDIIYNDSLLEKNKYLQVNRDGIKIYRNLNTTTNVTSYVLTNGLPFIPFTSFKDKYNILPEKLIDHLYVNYTIDISKNLYDPIQSRTELVGFEKHLPIIRNIIIDLSYHQSLFIIKYFIKRFNNTDNNKYLKNINEYISNYSSETTSWYNLILDADYDDREIKRKIKNLVNGNMNINISKRDLVMYHTLSKKNKSIGIILNIIYEELSKIPDFNKKYIDEFEFKYDIKKLIKNIISRNTNNEIVSEIILTTFEYKFSSIRKIENQIQKDIEEEEREIKKIEKKKKTLNPEEQEIRTKKGRKFFLVFRELFKSYCDVYYKILKNKLDFSYDEPPKIVFYNKFSTTVAYSQNEKIAINIANRNFSFANFFNIIELFYTDKLFNLFNDSAFNNYFGTLVYKESTIPHELEHFRSKTSHESTHHDRIPNYFKDPKIRIDFSEFVNLSYNYCRKHNLWILWRNKFIKNIRRMKLDETINNLRDKYLTLDKNKFNSEIKELVRDYIIMWEKIKEEPKKIKMELISDLEELKDICNGISYYANSSFIERINIYFSILKLSNVSTVKEIKERCKLQEINFDRLFIPLLSIKSKYYNLIKNRLDEDVFNLGKYNCGKKNSSGHHYKKLIIKYISILNDILKEKIDFSSKEITWKSKCKIIHSLMTKNYDKILFELLGLN